VTTSFATPLPISGASRLTRALASSTFQILFPQLTPSFVFLAMSVSSFEMPLTSFSIPVILAAAPW
jgi:hypothetical protein